MSLNPKDRAKERTHIELYKKYKDVLFDKDGDARTLIVEAGGEELLRPNVPWNWKVKIVRHFGLKYINPDNHEEWVKLRPGNAESKDPIARIPHVVYHAPPDKIHKDFRGLRPFVLQPDQHILEYLKEKFPDKKRRAKESYKKLRGYCFRLEDLMIIRRLLGFDDLPPDAILVVQSVIFRCHTVNFSQTQGGMMFKHRANPYYEIRFASHIHPKEEFIDIRTIDEGCYTQAGYKVHGAAPEAQIPVEDLLSIDLGWWYSPPCERIMLLMEFDYASESESDSEEDFCGRDPSKDSGR